MPCSQGDLQDLLDSFGDGGGAGGEQQQLQLPGTVRELLTHMARFLDARAREGKAGGAGE